MFEQTVHKKAQKALESLRNSPNLKKAYLAGGTACALHIGHRISVDLDFFTPTDFDSHKIVASLNQLGKFKPGQIKEHTVLGTFQDVKFSLFLYQYPIISDLQDFRGIKIADLKDIAAMKVAAISDRGTKRDFIDLHFICRDFTLSQTLSLFDKKYGLLKSNWIHILKSLVYFVDADEEEMPNMIKACQWNGVKKFFEREVRRIHPKP